MIGGQQRTGRPAREGRHNNWLDFQGPESHGLLSGRRGMRSGLGVQELTLAAMYRRDFRGEEAERLLRRPLL